MDKPEQIPALIVGEIGLVRSIGEAGIPLYVGSYYADNVSLYSRYCRKRLHFSHTTSEAFAEEMVRFGKAEKRKMVFFSDDDRAVLTFSRYREELSEYFYFNLPDKSVVEDVLDKRRFGKVARSAGIPVPLTFMPESAEDLARVADEIAFPCILKPASKDDWWHPDFLRLVGPYRKAIQCATKDELVGCYRKVIQVNPKVVVQEYIAGDDSNLFSVNMYFNARREMLAYFIGHKLRIYPVHAGVASLVETIDNPEMRDLALDAARKLNIQGHFNIQFKRDSNTQALKVMEIHTRNSLWCYLATGAGLNISAIAYYDMIGQPYPLAKDYHTGVKWLDIAKDIKGLKDYRRNGELTYGMWLRSLRGKRVHHILSLRDPVPPLADLWFITKRRFEHSVDKGAAPPH
jgi:predicted ATP-grasp superfamily ATP-dependent carboligase